METNKQEQIQSRKIRKNTKMTFDEVGKVIGLTGQSVHRIEKVIIAKMIRSWATIQNQTLLVAATQVMDFLEIPPNKFWNNIPDDLKIEIERVVELR